MIGVFDFLCDLFLLHSPKRGGRGGRGGRGSRAVILGSCFQILMKQPSAAVCGVESCLRQTKRTNNSKAVERQSFERDVSIGAPSTQWWVHLSVAIVFGLGFATMLTLLVTPATLMLFSNLKVRLDRRKNRTSAAPAE